MALVTTIPNIASGLPSTRAVEANSERVKPLRSACFGLCPIARHSTRSISRIREAMGPTWGRRAGTPSTANYRVPKHAYKRKGQGICLVDINRGLHGNHVGTETG